MAKKRVSGKVGKSNSIANERQILGELLSTQPKESLVELLVELAMDDRALRRRVEDAFDAVCQVDQLVAQTRQAIADATYFDQREINYNFDYDSAAYSRVQQNFERLVLLDQWDDVMPLAIELMKAGSYQIEMSDEGMMTEDVEACLRPVIAALAESDLPSKKVLSWCDAMTRADSVGFVCERLLLELRGQFNKS